MIKILERQAVNRRLLVWLVVPAVLSLALLFGLRPSARWLILLMAGGGGVLLLANPLLGLLLIPLAALLVRRPIATGSEVVLNTVTLLVPAMLAIWFLSTIRERRLHFVQSPTTLPLFLFLLAGLLSLLVGNVTWDPVVPKNDGFLLAQLAQWAIFAFSAGAFWLSGSMIEDEQWLKRLTVVFLAAGGGLAVFFVVPLTRQFVASITTVIIIRVPFWVLLGGLAGGQLFFNRALARQHQGLLIMIILATLVYAFIYERETASNWVGLTAVYGGLVWLRFERLRRWFIIVFAVLLLTGVLSSALWEFAGGDDEWSESGGSRLALQQRVVEDTMRNPITGLGPAAYRAYGATRPLVYGRIYWQDPRISSHNNYVDLFSHVGIVGLLLFAWFVFELARTGLRLRKRYTSGFTSGYVNGILAVGLSSLVIMALADWILPYVYNIGFPGFQASVLVWLFMGGLVALENMS